MNEVLQIHDLCKVYPAFTLDHVGFSVGRGQIMGFIGRNGAGKTTTLKSILNLVHPDGGSVFYFGMPFDGNESEIKQRIGYAAGSDGCYKKRKVGDLLDVTASFFDAWDPSLCERWLSLFALDRQKTVEQLSAGMKVKLQLVTALSHHAELLILDEPTSGLDPVSREELLEIFLQLKQEGVSILFSTHVTSDLEKCATNVTYIRSGRIVSSCGYDEFLSSYRIAAVGKDPSEKLLEAAVGKCLYRDGYTLLIPQSACADLPEADFRQPTLEDVMVHLEKGV